MYGWFDSCIVYGFIENDNQKRIDDSWLQTNYPDLTIAALDVTKFFAGNIVYGHICTLEENTGIIKLNEGSKEVVHEFYEHFLRSKQLEAKQIKLGYYSVISGDYHLEHEPYILE